MSDAGQGTARSWRQDLEPRVRSEIGRQHRRAQPHRALFAGLVVLLVWIPIPIGSNRPWSWAILEAGVFVLLAVFLVGSVWHHQDSSRAARSVAGPILVALVWLAYVVGQAVPLPNGVLRVLSPEVYAQYQQTVAFGAPGHGAISVDRGATLTEVLKYAAYVATFVLVVHLATSRRRLRIMAWSIVAVGFAQTLYGLAIYLSKGQLGLWDPGWARNAVRGTYLTGTYVNRNHVAGLLEMTIGLGLGLALAYSENLRFRVDLAGALRWLAGVALSTRVQLLLCLAIMTAALVLTTSRGGMGALAVSTLFVSSLSFALRGRGTRELRAVPWLAMLAVVATLWFGFGAAEDKLLDGGFGSDRPELRAATYQMIEHSPVFGWGAGSFPVAFPRFKTQSLGRLFYDHAHNDYLELISEQGVVGGALLGIAIGWIALITLRGYRVQHDAQLVGIAFGAMVGAGSLAIHGWVDFNFHIPANATYFAALLGIAVAASQLEGRRSALVAHDEGLPTAPSPARETAQIVRPRFGHRPGSQ